MKTKTLLSFIIFPFIAMLIFLFGHFSKTFLSFEYTTFIYLLITVSFILGVIYTVGCFVLYNYLVKKSEQIKIIDPKKAIKYLQED